jgi:hypothetical protein
MKLHNCLSIMRFTWLEMSRLRVWHFALLVILIGCAVAEFGAALAVTESTAHRSTFYAAGMRLGAVFVVALIVCVSVLREFDDKGIEAVLSRPVSRSDWYCGRFIGYAGMAIGFAALVAVPLVLQQPLAALSWACSLALELVLVTAATLAFTITVRQVPAALCAVAGFYLLARGITGFGLMVTGPTVDPAAASARVIAGLVDGLAHVLPALDRYTQTAWFTTPPTAGELGFLVVQTIVYAALLGAVGLFDLHRRNF